MTDEITFVSTFNLLSVCSVKLPTNVDCCCSMIKTAKNIPNRYQRCMK